MEEAARERGELGGQDERDQSPHRRRSVGMGVIPLGSVVAGAPASADAGVPASVSTGLVPSALEAAAGVAPARRGSMGGVSMGVR